MSLFCIPHPSLLKTQLVSISGLHSTFFSVEDDKIEDYRSSSEVSSITIWTTYIVNPFHVDHCCPILT